jgi:AcrR family transcriptional regulator
VADTGAAPVSTLAERKRQLVRDELAEAAVKILAWRGFEETTVEQIVAAVGVSRRTFFRYFQSKEDVIVHVLAGAGTQLCADLRARPAGEPPAAALRHALAPIISISVDNPDKTLRVSKLILDTPALLARFLERLTQWQAGIADILAQRTGLDARTDLRPTLAAGVALTAFHTALRRWTDSDGGQDLADIVDQAFAFVSAALDLPTGTA